MNKPILESKMKLHGDNQSKLADALGISLTRFNAKLNQTDNAKFTLDEVRAIKKRYNLTDEEVNVIFLN